MWNPEDWSEEVAGILAAESGLEEIGETHWRVIRFLRNFYFHNGRAPLNRDLKAEIGLSLMEMEALFPEGSVGRPPYGRLAQSQIMFGVGRMSGRLIYLDNAATTFPKPRGTLNRMVETYQRMGVSPGRGGYDLATEAEALVEAEEEVARLFGAPDPNRVIFAANATDALNLAIQGVLTPGDHVVSTRLEHNSVLRPLYHLREQGLIEYDLMPFDGKGFVDPGDIAGAIRPNTSLVIVCHASNVLGTIQPIPEIGRLCAGKGVPLLIDAAQSAGVVPIDLDAWRVAAVAFTGHKSLLGPTGIGGLIIHPELEVRTTRFGGTGVDSKNPDPHPDLSPSPGGRDAQPDGHHWPFRRTRLS